MKTTKSRQDLINIGFKFWPKTSKEVMLITSRQHQPWQNLYSKLNERQNVTKHFAQHVNSSASSPRWT